MIGSFARTMRRVALSGAVAIGMAGGTLGLAAQPQSAHAAVVYPYNVAPTAGVSAGAGTDNLATAPTDTGLNVTAGTGSVIFSADTNAITLAHTEGTPPIQANGQTGVGIYSDTTFGAPSSTAAYSGTGAHYGQLLYRIGLTGTVQPVLFPLNSLGPVTVTLPAGHDTGDVFLFVNDTQYGDNSGPGGSTTIGFAVNVTLPPTFTKAFSTTPATSPTTVISGQPATLTFTITNPNLNGSAGDLGGISFTDTLPTAGAGTIGVGGATIGAGCTTGTITTTGTSTILLTVTNVTVAAGATCTITVPVTYTLASNATNTTLTNTTSTGTYSLAGGQTVAGTFPAASAQLIVVALHLAIVSGNNQVTPANFSYTCPLVVQAQDSNNNPITTPINVTFTITPAPTNGAGARFFPGVLITTVPTTGATSFTVPAGCPNGGTSYTGVAVVYPSANGIPSLPSATPPPTLQQYTIVATAPGSTNTVTFNEANGQVVANSCSLRIGFFSSTGTTQFSAATGKLLGGRRTLINYLTVRGSGGSLIASPITSSVVCQLAYTFTPVGTPLVQVRLPEQVDFNATVNSSSVPGIATLSTIHVTIKKDLGASPPVESVTVTDLPGTTTFYSFDPSNSSIAPRSFVISAV